MTDNPDLIRQHFIEAAGHATQTFGFGRIVGQVYAHLYLSREPQTLDHLCEQLSISKGSASMVVRQLESWSALKRVWIKGERKDHYIATEEFGKIFRSSLVELVGKTMETTDGLLSSADTVLSAKNGRAARGNEDLVFLRDRIGKVRKFRDRAQYLWNSPVIRMLFK